MDVKQFGLRWAAKMVIVLLTPVLIVAVGCSRTDEPGSLPTDVGGFEKRCPPVTVTYSDPFNQDQLSYPGSGGIKDFCLIKAGTTTHLFHITDPGLGWSNGGELSFGHATSEDLFSWTTLSRIENLRTDPAEPNSWSESSVWAPHVIEKNGTYYMFYTGVEWSATSPNVDHWQRIGLATSTNLDDWTRYDVSGQNGLILDGPDPAVVAWSVYPADTLMHDCRDPFVFDNGSEYVMFVSTKAVNASADTAAVIAYATSTNLVDWTWGNYVAATWGSKAESPNVLKYNGFYYLMWTYKADAIPQGGAVKIAYSTSIFGPYTTITSATPLFGIGNETLLDPPHTVYAAFDDLYVLHLKRDLVLPLVPLPGSLIEIKEFTECDPGFTDIHPYDSP